MKQYILLAIALLTANFGFAQKYKTVYESIKYIDENEAFQILENFSYSKNNRHPASLFKMATILEHRVSTYDPFLQDKAIYQNLKNISLYLQLAKFYLDEKVAKQDAIYFDSVVASNPKKGPTFEEISNDIDKRLNKAALYRNHFEQNRSNLYNASSKYNKCIEIFNEINKRNSNLKDLYFLADENLRKQLDELKINFDSTIYFLTELQNSLKEYPMLNYKFNYRLNPIVTYRMHGLTQANFLAPEIQLWNFSLWIDTFYKTVNEDVAYLYNSVQKFDNLYDEYVSLFKEDRIDEMKEQYKLPVQLLNKIYKYDFVSLAGALLTYQQSRVDFLQQLSSYQKDTSLLTFGEDNPAIDYFDLAISKRFTSDSLLKCFEKGISENEIKKYSIVFEKKYNGEAGLKQYVSQQKLLGKLSLDNKVNAFAENMISLGMHDADNSNFLIYNNDTLYAQTISLNEIWKDGYFVHDKAVTAQKQTLVSGSYVNKKTSERLGFVAKIDTAQNIVWLKQFKQGDGNKACLHVTPINDDIATIVTSISKTGAIRNFLLLLDNAGNVKQTSEIKANEIPRKMLVDEISNKYIVVLGGTSLKPFTMETNNIHFVCLNSNLGLEWDKQIPFVGYICNVLKANNKYYIAGAYSKISGLANETVEADNGAELFIYSIDAEGNWLTDNYFDTGTATYPVWVSKVDNARMEVVSLLDNEPKRAEESTINAKYVQYSFDGDELFTSK